MAKRKTIKCSKCDRKFSMAAHLARHLGTIHKRKANKRVAKKRTVSAKPKRKPGRPKTSAKKKAQRTRAKRVVARGRGTEGIGGIVADLRAYRNELESKLARVREALRTLGE